jgi:RimJ/RimL family protein N-acetyltransferase
VVAGAPHILLETDRLRLRRFAESDVDDLTELDGDPRVMRFLTGGKPTPRHTIEQEVLPKIILGYGPLLGCGRWAAIEKESGRFLGWFALDVPDSGTSDDVELGYRLRADAWGRGYATEGSRALIRTAFREHGVHRIWAQTMAVNLRSRRVLERVGLRLVRTFHLSWDEPIEGAEHGEVEYELLREDWERLDILHE